MESQQQTKHPVAMFLLGSMLIEVQTQRPLTLLLDDLSSSFGRANLFHSVSSYD